MNAKTKKLVLTILKNVLAWIISLIMLIPLLLIVINAFKPDSEAMTLSLTFDHRALDGAPAARFLQELCKNLENFTMLLIK